MQEHYPIKIIKRAKSRNNTVHNNKHLPHPNKCNSQQQELPGTYFELFLERMYAYQIQDDQYSVLDGTKTENSR